MSMLDGDGPSTLRARQSLPALRTMLTESRNTPDLAQVQAVVVDVIDGLIAHAERQANAVEELRSDLGHKQGIVTKIGGGDFHPTPASAGPREFAASSNGDRWFLARDGESGIARVVHKGNEPSGGATTPIELGAFLNRGASTPETLALLRLIGTLVG